MQHTTRPIAYSAYSVYRLL